MPFVPVNNVAMLEIRQLLDAQQVENTLYFLNETGWTAGELLTLATNAAVWHSNNMLPLLSQSLTLHECFVTDLTTSTSGVAVFPVSPPGSGSVIEESMSNNVAACVSIRTAKRGRANRGRNFIAGIPTNVVTHNTLSTTFADAIVDAYATLRTTMAASQFEMVVVSRYSGYTIVGGKKVPTPRTAGLVEPVVSFSFTDLTVDSMRTRLPNH